MLEAAQPDASPVTDDPMARCLLERAQGALQKWPEDFAGFRARIRCRCQGTEALGAVSVRPHGGVDVELPDPRLAAWAREVLADISRQLTPCFFKDGDGRFPIRLLPEDGHPLGRLLLAHTGGSDRAAYRVDRAGRLRLAERVSQGKRWLVTFDELVRATPGRVLPRRTTTSCWDLAGGALVRSEVVTATHHRLGHAWLPERRVAASQGPSGHETALLELTRHRLL